MTKPVKESELINSLFEQLTTSEVKKFPQKGKPDAPSAQGVYIVQDPQGEVLHVGSTPRGTIVKRLGDHLVRTASSFGLKYLIPRNINLRDGYAFRYLVVVDPRKRALVEYYAIGRLCPAHLGTGEAVATLSA